MKSVRISGFAAVWCCGDADTWRPSWVVVASQSLGVVGCVVLGNVPVCYPGLTGLYCWCCLWCGHCACILLPGFGGLCCSWHCACICHCSFTNTNQSFNHKMVSWLLARIMMPVLILSPNKFWRIYIYHVSFDLNGIITTNNSKYISNVPSPSMIQVWGWIAQYFLY